MPNYPDAISKSLQDLYSRFINFLPAFIVAVVILVVGWIVAVYVSKLIKRALVAAKVDETTDKLGLDQISAKTGMKMSVAGAIAWLVKWFLLIALFLAAADILGLAQISDFLYNVLYYIPNVVAAAAIMLLGIMVAKFVSKLVRHSVAAAGLTSADFLGAITQWSIVIFAVLATLDQLKVAQAFVQTLFTGIVVMIAIAGGLAFGLGGKDHASRVLDKIERDIKS
jgi:hypothetical protein